MEIEEGRFTEAEKHANASKVLSEAIDDVATASWREMLALAQCLSHQGAPLSVVLSLLNTGLEGAFMMDDLEAEVEARQILASTHTSSR